MEFLLEALFEALFQLIFEVIIAFLDFALESLLGHRTAEKVRVMVSSIFYLLLGTFGGWVSVGLLPRPLVASTAGPLAYFVVLPMISATALFLMMKASDRSRARHSLAVLGWYCVALSWAFSVGRYYFLP